MKDQTIKAIFAMGCIAAIEITMLIMGINGQIATLVVGAIAGLGGFAIGKMAKDKPAS